MTAEVYCTLLNKDRVLSIDAVRHLLENVDVSRVSTDTAQRPKAGEVYVYGDTTTNDDWVADGYRWCSVGCARLPRRRPVVYRWKFQTVKRLGSSPEFQRIAYVQLGPGANEYILVHYIGDETVAEVLPHGNVKDLEEARPYKRSLPSAYRPAELIARSSKNSLYNNSCYSVKVGQCICNCIMMSTNCIVRQ